MTEPERHDWPAIIRELERAGLTIYKIAMMVGCQYSQVQRWREPDTLKLGPRHYEGQKLLAIHNEYCNRGTA